MKQFGLIGKSLSHSFSKIYFENKFQRESDIRSSYQDFPLERVEDFKTLIGEVDLSGLNVTIPYKETIIPFLDEMSIEAKAIGAVNTIQFKNDKIIGYNTDYIGFHNSIKPFLENTMECALILGTGGASKAVVYALERIGIKCLCVSRTPVKNQLSYDELNEFVIKYHLLIVNTTPLGTSPNTTEYPTIPYQFIGEKHLLVDLVYNPEETLFLKKGKENRAMILNGKSMLIHQAEAAWKIWNP
jgi:shikimate dehydrogenase